jgi:hypothetical protein
MADSLAFVNRNAELYQAAEKSEPAKLAMADFCQVLFSLNEFIYID